MSRGAVGTTFNKKAGNYLGKVVANALRTEHVFLSRSDGVIAGVGSEVAHR